MKLRSMTFLSLLIIFSIAVAHVNADSKVENEVKTPISSKNLDEEYYDDLVTDFKKAGFTDVVVKKDEDLIFGFVHFDGEVEEIQIGKTTNFKKGASFSKNDKVTITYHTYSNRDQKILKLELDREFTADENGNVEVNGITEKGTQISSSDEQSIDAKEDGKFSMSFKLKDKNDSKIRLDLKNGKKNRVKYITLHQNKKVIERIESSEEASASSSIAASENAAREKQKIDDYNKNHIAYKIDFYDYKKFYVLDTQNHQIFEITKYDNEESAVVTTASYTGDMNTAIDFTFDFGEGGSYSMHAYNKYNGLPKSGAIFTGVNHGSSNKASYLEDSYGIAKKYLGIE